jgi:hypothetical protein
MALASVISPLIAVESTDVALSVRVAQAPFPTPKLCLTFHIRSLCQLIVMGCVNLIHLVAFAIPSAPPVPPTYAASLPSPSFLDGVRLFLGDAIKLPFLTPPTDDEGAHRSRMTARERIDLWIVFAVYTLLVACGTALQVEIASIFMCVRPACRAPTRY